MLSSRRVRQRLAATAPLDDRPLTPEEVARWILLLWGKPDDFIDDHAFQAGAGR